MFVIYVSGCQLQSCITLKVCCLRAMLTPPLFADSQQSGSPSHNEPGKTPLPGTPPHNPALLCSSASMLTAAKLL